MKTNITLHVMILILVCSGFPVEPQAGTPWVKSFVPSRTVYVAPEERGNGKGVDPQNAKSFMKAIKSARAGDLNLLLPGTYRGKFTLTSEGGNGKPIVWKASPGAHVQIIGAIEVTAKNIWIWGLDISDPTNSVNADSALRLWAQNVVAVNNVIHDVQGKNGIGAWDQGPGQIIYGNILYNTRGIYTQNNYDKFGNKYFVANIIGEAGDPTSPESDYNFHAYTVKDDLSGFYVKDNYSWNGNFLIGGRSKPEQNNTVRENYFYNNAVSIGFRRPTQIEFLNNYLGRSTLNSTWLWGTGEVQHEQKKPNIYTGNEIINPRNGMIIKLRTSAYTSKGRQEGVPSIRSSDHWDNNIYSDPFGASVQVGGQENTVRDLTAWRQATLLAGNQFDANSKIIPPPSAPKIVVTQNQYDLSRLHVAVVNWSNESSVTISSNLIPTSATYEVFAATNLFGPALLSGKYEGTIRIPISKEFETFIIKFS